MPTGDPRLLELLRSTANGALMDRAIRHGTFLQRVANREVSMIVGFLNDKVFPDLVGRLTARLDRIRSRGFDAGVQTTKRYRDMIDSLRGLIRSGVRSANGILGEELRQLALTEAEWQRAVLGESVPKGIGLDFQTPSPAILRAIVREMPMRGRLIKDWFRDIGDDAMRRVEEQIGIGLAQGETVDQMVRRVRGTRAAGFTDGVLQTTRRQAATLVRTAVNHVTTQAKRLTFQENSDLIKGQVWVATLDARLCPICFALDGKFFPLDGKDPPGPPVHPDDRCTLSAVTKSWKELGIDLDEAPEGTRATMNGQIPSSIKAPEWLMQQPIAVQNEVLGVERARLWRQGKISTEDVINDRFRTLTIKELRAKEGLD